MSHSPYALLKHPLDLAIWGMIAAIFCLDFILIMTGNVHISPEPVKFFFRWGAACMVVALIGRYLLKDTTVYGFGITMLQLHFASIALAWLTYLCARFNYPLHDETLIALDHMLGFEWRSLLHWMNAHPRVAIALSFCYLMFSKQIIILLCLLCAFKHMDRAKGYMMAFIISCALTAILSGLIPAMGAYVHYNLTEVDYANIFPAVPRVHEDVYVQLRDHRFNTLPWLYNIKGVVTFPSFHATAAVLFMYAGWPLVWIRWLVIALNLGMIASAPIDGGHYLVDVIAGVAIGILSLVLVTRISRYGKT